MYNSIEISTLVFKLLRTMEVVILLIFGYLLVKICWKILRHILSPETTVIWLVSLGLMVFGLSWIGLLILGWRYLLIPIVNYQKRHPKRHYGAKKEEEEGIHNETVMWLIPIFWPFLVAKRLLGGKTLPNDNSPFDYEQHLKSNGK